MFQMDKAQRALLRKVVWTGIAIPMFYKTCWAYNWQLERKVWKEELINDRTKKLSNPTQTCKLEDIPLDTMTKEEFDEKWLYKPIKLRGLFDHEKETMIQRTRDGDRGYEILTPLYMEVNKKTGNLNGMMVNRGRIPYEYRDSGMHWTPKAEEQEVEGVLFYDEGDDPDNKKEIGSSNSNKYSEIRINLSELIGNTDIANKDFASRIYLKGV